MEIVEKTKLTRRVLVEKFEFMGIGTIVKVKYPGERYASYTQKFKEMMFKNCEIGRISPKFFKKKEFKIFSKSEFHSNILGFQREDILLCGIEDEEGNQFLFNQSALSYIE